MSAIQINRILLRKLDEMIRGQTDSHLFPYRTMTQIEDFFGDLWIDIETAGSRSGSTFLTLSRAAAHSDEPDNLLLSDAICKIIIHLMDYQHFGDDRERYDRAILEINKSLLRFGIHLIGGDQQRRAVLAVIDGETIGGTRGADQVSSLTLGDYFVARPRVFALPKGRTSNRLVCGVLMPFTAELDEIYDTIIRPSAEDAGFMVHRADDIWKHEKVMDDIVELILTSSVIVADLTGQNANVFYEVGIAHLAGTIVVPIVQNKNDVPFDIRSDRYLLYHNTEKGRAQLKSKLKSRLVTISELRGGSIS